MFDLDNINKAQKNIENLAGKLKIDDPHKFAKDIIGKLNTDDLKSERSTNDNVTVGSNITDHFDDNPMMDRLKGLVAGALVVTGIGTTIAGIKKRNREQALRGAKQTLWGVYHGLDAVDTLFKTAISLTPGLRFLGGFINADLGLTGIYKDYKADKKVDPDKAIFNSAATMWGLRHMAMGAQGLAKSKWAAGILEKGSKIHSQVLSKAPLMGAIGAALGVAGGVLDAALGVRGFIKGVNTDNKEKKVLGALDIGVGLAMAASCALTGIPGIIAAGIGSAGMGYRFWRTDKKFIKHTWKQVKNKTKKIKNKVKKTVKKVLGIESPADENKIKDKNMKTE